MLHYHDRVDEGGVMRKSVHSIAILGIVAALLLAASVSGQGRQPATPTDELLTEVRALRADINNAAKSEMRAQLLGMRLQLQEQRIGVVSGSSRRSRNGCAPTRRHKQRSRRS